jgi:hypothetical protein
MKPIPNALAFVDAVYRTETDPRYAGNPYVEALPSLPDDLELARALNYMPPFYPEDRQLSAPERIQMLDTVQSIVVALPRLVRLGRAMLRLMRTGYQSRRPFSRSDNQTLRDLYTAAQSGAFRSMRENSAVAQLSMALIGASGCGKSFGMRQVAGLFPKAIYHEACGKWQLPFIFIEMAYDGESVHTLASALFAELDRLLPDARYTEMYMDRKGLNAQQRMAKALSIAYEHGAGMIVVDEHQNQRHLGDESPRRPSRRIASPKNETPLAKLLITASNTSQNQRGGRFSGARRQAGHGSAVWMPLERSGDLTRPGEFEQLLKALWRYQWMRIPVELTDAWCDIFYRHTQGIPDVMVKLFESCQEAAIASKKETFTPELVAAVAKAEFSATAYGITALREGDKMLLEGVTDLYQQNPVAKVKEAAAEFPLPRNHTVVPKAPRGAPAEGASVAKPGGGRSPTRHRPSPIAISIEVAPESDLRATLARTLGTPTVAVVDLSKPAPL